MLYEEGTTGAVVAGYAVGVEGMTGAQAEELQTALRELNGEYDTSIRMIVPGDSATDHAMNPDMELYAWTFVFGVPAVMAGPWSCPAEVTADGVSDALADVSDVPAELWDALADAIPGDDFDFEADPQVYLTSFGPLPYACLAAGVTHPSDEKGSTTYKFFSVQDMSQQWLEEGVDGKRIKSVEFTSVSPVDLSAEAIDEWLAKVDELDDPSIWLTVRYD
jgi:hypothetical protein